jgi:hypothetical protein
MESKRRRELTLASIALAVLAIAMWTVRGGSAPLPAQAPAASTPPQAKAAEPGHPFAGVNLDALQIERPEPEASRRNPFRFKPAPAPPPPTPPSRGSKPGPEGPGGDIATGPPPPAPPPRITLKYIGDMTDPKKPGGRIAILSDGRSVYHGREGDVVEGRYQILRIGAESVDLAYLDGRGRQTIRQTGQ